MRSLARHRARIATVGVAAFSLATGWLVGQRLLGASPGHSQPSPSPGDTLVVGRAVVHGDHGMSVPLDSILRAHPERVLIVFNARCSTCVGEAQVWQRIERERPHAVVALAFTPDQEFLRSFRERARVTFEVWRCDEAVIKALGLAGLPSIFVLADNRVLFSKYGPEATIGLEGWIARRTGLHDESSVG